ncbi:MAG: hypothetical protein AB1916_08190 [Thermodesulfobacteriota bacterium]
MPWLSASLMWLALCATAVAAGALRVKLLEPRLGELRAHQAGALGLIPVMFGLTCLWVGLSDLETSPFLPEVGRWWLLLTVAFEFGFGLLVMRQPLRRLLADYNLLRGRLWPVFLAALTLSPPLAGRLLGP